MQPTVQRISFQGSSGDELAARLDRPAGPIRATAVFAHCFTCSKDIAAAKRIAGELARQGFAVLRFDFTGLGMSGGEFANTDFSSNIEDLKHAAGWLRANLEAPAILIGHSLGGAAVLAVAADIPEVRAVATIGAPADADHVIKNFAADLDRIERDGEADVRLAGRPFRIRKQFLDDIRGQNLAERVAAMNKALMVLHSPLDDVVGIENAAAIFTAARHPKSFVSLDRADHLLTEPADSTYVAGIIAAWAARFIAPEAPAGDREAQAVTVTETGENRFQNYVIAGRHRLFADEPPAVGGLDSGPSPYDFLAVALGACTSMTLRMYADHKKYEVGQISVAVAHGKVHAADCAECSDEQRESGGKIDRFARTISIAGDISPEIRAGLLRIADKCPVHRTLESGAVVVTELTSS